MPDPTKQNSAPDWTPESSYAEQSAELSPPPRNELLDGLPTDELHRIRAALRLPIPSDPTFLSAVSRVLSHLLGAEIAHPARVERDQQIARQQAQQRIEADEAAMVARHEAEHDALGPDADAQAHEALDAKHERERRLFARTQRLMEIDRQQAAARDEFAAKQKAERDAVMNEDQPQAA